MLSTRKLPGGFTSFALLWGERALMVCIALGIGWLDYATGPDFSIILFYTLLIAWVVWRVERAAAVASAVGIATWWAVINVILAPESYRVSLQIKLWNALMVFGVFVAFAAVIHRMKVAYRQQRDLNAQLSVARAELDVLEGLLPICAWCKSIRTANGTWVSIESYITSRSPSLLTHSICPTCEAKI